MSKKEPALPNARWPLPGLVILALALGGCGERPVGQQAGAGQTGSASVGAPEAGGITDSLILAAVLVALPPPGITPADLPDPNSEGAKALVAYCAQCHNLSTPTIHSAADWPSVVRRMWLRLDRLPPTFSMKVPTIQERQATLNYLVANALKVSKANLPQGAGRDTFARICGRCHALPDPRNHSLADWPAVVTRMEQRMVQMKVDPPGQAETRQITAYLGGVSGMR